VGKRKECRKGVRSLLKLLDSELAELTGEPGSGAMRARAMLRVSRDKRLDRCAVCARCDMSKDRVNRLPLSGWL
jgi:hypothetical protein